MHVADVDADHLVGAFENEGERIVAAGALQVDGAPAPPVERPEPRQVLPFDGMEVALAGLESPNAVLVRLRVVLRAFVPGDAVGTVARSNLGGGLREFFTSPAHEMCSQYIDLNHNTTA